MDLKKFSGFILLAGMAVSLYGLFVMMTNQPNRPENLVEILDRQAQLDDGEKKMVIGGIILFVGVAVRLSSKSGQANGTESTITPRTSDRIQNRLNLLALAGGLLIFISIFLPSFEWYVVANGPSSIIVAYPYDMFFIGIFKDIKYANVRLANHGISIVSFIISILVKIISSLIFIGGGITAISAFTKHKKAVLASALTGLVGFFYVVLPSLTQESNNEVYTSFNFGFYVFTAGVICLLISTGKAFFDRKESTN